MTTTSLRGLPRPLWRRGRGRRIWGKSAVDPEETYLRNLQKGCLRERPVLPGFTMSARSSRSSRSSCSRGSRGTSSGSSSS
eukprot:6387713-Pyramimonas_sp.AAC.1